MSTSESNTPPAAAPSLDFIRQIVEADRVSGRHQGRVHTRFPPEPNGYLHIGHAKSICLNFGVALEFGGLVQPPVRRHEPGQGGRRVRRLPSVNDVQWLGFTWDDREFYASDYFEQLYQYAEQLVRDGKAYVDDLTAEQIREYRGTLTEPGRESPYRNRPAEENLDLFRRMRAGEFEDGAKVLRAKIDMSSGNINMRDPVLYRIKRATHHRTGDAWCIYPMYDYAHPHVRRARAASRTRCARWSSRITGRSTTGASRTCRCPAQPRQIEFARLNLTYTMMSKRKLLRLVQEGHVRGWDDPRMPTLARHAPPGLHARGDARLRRRGSASRRRRTSSRSTCSSTACARISTSARRA